MGFNDNLVWIAPIRTKPKRTYDEPATSFSPEGAHIPYAIRNMLASGPGKEKFKVFMDKIGKESGLFQSIVTKEFGDSSDAPFEVDVILDGKEINLTWVGYGVSQSLPILVELLERPNGSWFAIQQPEVHLHPRAQAALGDVFFEMAMVNDLHFVIETHSDFAIDRFRMNYRKKRSKKDSKTLPQSQILFFERSEKRNTVVPLLIGQRGEMPTDQPDGYRDFFIKEEMHLLDV
jgi:predicted ATPase